MPGINRKAAFSAQIKRLQKYFGKTLKPEQITEYGRALRFVPAEALEEIAQQTIDETQPTPGRFPNPAQLLERFYQWQAGNPLKRADYPKTDCPVCQSEFGLLNGAREQGGITYRVVARCAACENWLANFARRSAGAPLMRPEQLEAQGYEMEYPPKSPIGRPRPVKELAGQVGEHLNPGQRAERFEERKRV